MTVMVWELSVPRLTVKTALTVALLPSVTVTSLMLMEGWRSSFTMVPMAWLSAMNELVALERIRRKNSLGSNLVSPLTSTVNVCVNCPGAKVSVPLALW